MIVDEIMNILIKHRRTDVPIENSTLLFEGGLELDSIGFLELVLEIESHAGVLVRDEDLDEGALQNVGTFVAQIVKKVEG